MNRYPSWHFSIAESCSGPSQAAWPAALNFPIKPAGKLFSIDHYLPRTPKVLIFTLDLSSLQNAEKMRIH
ncbi:hypothetical protein [Photobacterium atrarenae]|uniref:Uncharacterized protein n=1 Tax=Photobacterium atrarenae TaxID=865757 RepID=A0ABY5GL42_9GAMM|nr:hypothetical protein [Photobacterium atrarenae]UTV29455.1 hypothetical protein NNL38_20770 [Photobacterium atrarenae]